MTHDFQTKLNAFGDGCAWDKLDQRLAHAKNLATEASRLSALDASAIDWNSFDLRFGRSAGPECLEEILQGFLRGGTLFDLASSPMQAIQWSIQFHSLHDCFTDPRWARAFFLGGQDAADALMACGSAHRACKAFPDIPAFADHAQASDTIDCALRSGLLDTIAQAGAGAAWILACVKFCDLERMRQAVSFGLRLDSAPLIDAQNALARLAIHPVHLLDEFNGKGPTRLDGPKGAALGMAADRKRLVWTLAVECGMPLVEPLGSRALLESEWFPSAGGLPYLWGDRQVIVPSSLALFEACVLTGSMLSAQCIGWWIAASEHPIQASKLFEGKPPFAWAIEKGLPLAKNDALSLWLSATGPFSQGAGPHHWLAQLDALGWPLDEAARRGRAPDEHTQAEPALAICAAGAKSEVAMALAIKLGADLLCTVEDAPLLGALISRSNSRASKTTKILLDGALSRGGEAMAKQLCTHAGPDVSFALHWAARSLSPDSCELLVQAGADPNAVDAKGNHAGHWLAKNYSDSHAKKMAATIDMLTRLGVDWNLLNHAGASAASMLGARSPIEAIRAIAMSAPESMGAKSGKSKSALEKLQARGGQALSVAEEIIFDSALAGSLGKPSKKSKAKSL